MTGDPADPGRKSEKIRADALNILKDTRAKIDPAILTVMKEKLAHLLPGHKPEPVAPPPPPSVAAKDRAASFQAILDEAAKRQKQSAPVPPPSTPPPPAAASPTPVPKTPSTAVEAVDKQKVNQIVLEYMKRRQDTKKH